MYKNTVHDNTGKSNKEKQQNNDSKLIMMTGIIIAKMIIAVLW